MNYRTAAQWLIAPAIGPIPGVDRGRHARDEGRETRLADIRSVAPPGLPGGIAGPAARLITGIFVSAAARVVAACWRQTPQNNDFVRNRLRSFSACSAVSL